MTLTFFVVDSFLVFDGGECDGVGGLVGNFTVNIVPSPSVDSTSTDPFIRCRRCFTMLSPNPVPWRGLVSDVSACLNGWKSALRNDLGIPQPESLTLMTTWSKAPIETATPI